MAKELFMQVTACKWTRDMNVQESIFHMTLCNIQQDIADRKFDVSVRRVISSLLESEPSRTYVMLRHERIDLKKAFIMIKFGQMFIKASGTGISMTDFLKSEELLNLFPNATTRIDGLFSKIEFYYNECQRDPQIRLILDSEKPDFGEEFQACITCHVKCDTMVAVFNENYHNRIIRAAELNLIKCSNSSSSIVSNVTNTASAVISNVMSLITSGSAPSSPALEFSNSRSIFSIIDTVEFQNLDESDLRDVYYEEIKSPFDPAYITNIIETNISRKLKAGDRRYNLNFVLINISTFFYKVNFFLFSFSPEDLNVSANFIEDTFNTLKDYKKNVHSVNLKAATSRIGPTSNLILLLDATCTSGTKFICYS